MFIASKLDPRTRRSLVRLFRKRRDHDLLDSGSWSIHPTLHPDWGLFRPARPLPQSATKGLGPFVTVEALTSTKTPMVRAIVQYMTP